MPCEIVRDLRSIEILGDIPVPDDGSRLELALDTEILLREALGVAEITPLTESQKMLGGIVSTISRQRMKQVPPSEIARKIEKMFDVPRKRNETDDEYAKRRIQKLDASVSGLLSHGELFMVSPSVEEFIKVTDCLKSKDIVTQVDGTDKTFFDLIVDIVRKHSDLFDHDALDIHTYLKNIKNDPDFSTWGIYALLNLLGQQILENSQRVPKQAVRFSHVFIANCPEALTISNISVSIKYVFDQKKFPYVNKLMELTYHDPRLSRVQFDKLQTFEIQGNTIRGAKNTEISPAEWTKHTIDYAPMACIVRNNVSEVDLANRYKQIAEFLDHSPFVIMFHEQPSGEYIAQMLTNHEYLDGISSAYYLRTICDEVGLKVRDITNESQTDLKTWFTKADSIENSFAPEDDDRYKIDTVVFNNELLSQISKEYAVTSESLAEKELYIDPNAFLTIKLFARYVNGDDVRGGTLRFDSGQTVQLTHTTVEDMQELERAVREVDIEALRRMNCITKRGDKDYIVLYHKSRDPSGARENMSTVIELVRSIEPIPFGDSNAWEVINYFSKISGVAGYLSGQYMMSQIPETMRIKYRDEAGVIQYIEVVIGGTGGPAMTEFQQLANTALIKFENERYTLVIIRQKARKMLEDPKH